jgi:hypothetical protein
LRLVPPARRTCVMLQHKRRLALCYGYACTKPNPPLPMAC